MFSFFRKKPADAQAAPAGTQSATLEPAGQQAAAEAAAAAAPQSPRRSWIERLRGGLRKTGSSITQVFSAARIDDALERSLARGVSECVDGLRGVRPGDARGRGPSDWATWGKVLRKTELERTAVDHAL